MTTLAAEATRPPPAIRIRYRIFALVFGASFLLYLQRTTLSVVAVPLAREYGFSALDISWLFNAFLVSYTLFQVPGGLLGQRFGARAATLGCILLSAAGTALFALAPALAPAGLLFGVLAAARFVSGVSQGPLFPVNMALVQRWFPPRRWALMLGINVTGLSLGAAATSPIISRLMTDHGWQFAVYAASVPGLLLAAVWWWYVRETPRLHPGTGAVECAEIAAGGVALPAPRFDWGAARRVLVDRNVLLLTLGYGLMNYVFFFFMNWSFTYLVNERHLSVLEGGWLAAVPLVTGAVCASIGGTLCDFACARFGPRWGFRVVPLVMLPLAALLLSVAVRVPDPLVAVAALAGCFGAAQMTESPFWAATFWVSGEQASGATGLLNTGGNVGGIVGTFLVGFLNDHYGWGATFATGIGFALASAALWLFIDVGVRRVTVAGAAA
jgi:ACS family glucarate transporter-like MFS transporter